MSFLAASIVVVVAFAALGCAGQGTIDTWQHAVNQQVGQLGYRNWIVVAEASFPAHSRPGIRQVTSTAEIPEVVDFVLTAMERTEHVRPKLYLTREIRDLENDVAPGVDELRKAIRASLHNHETTELDQQSLITLLGVANESFDVLVIRTATALPYASVFMELQPGYWDAESEDRLRQRIERQRMEKIARPIP